jgi:3-deoxy-D-manno-octulosonic-acid transferase
VTATLATYRALTSAGAPLIRFYLARRRREGREDSARFAERMGIAGRLRPAGPLVWIHAASVGEALSALPLIERLRGERPGLAILVTTGTVTSARVLERRLPQPAIHQYVPVDRAAWVARFLDHWRPDLALWLESELWPNMLDALARRGVPTVLLNARLSPRSLARWRCLPGTIRHLLASFTLCLAQSAREAAALEALGAARVAAPGNLKFAAPPLPADAAELARLQRALGDRPRWVAASTHPGEEEAVEAAHRALAARHPGLLSIVVPRHEPRGAAIAAMLRAHGHRVALRSAGETPGPDDAFYLADTMGELGLFFRLAPVVFMGGSLVPHGGQNLLEPVRLGASVVHGPHMSNFQEIAAEIAAAGGTAEVGDADGLAEAVGALLADPALRARRVVAAARVAAAKSCVLDEVMAELAPLLAAIAPSEAAPRHARA